MKIAYQDIINRIKSNPSIEEISLRLFQLGHEHEFKDNIFNFEITPNRGDCLSVKGILRDLAVFYEIDFYEKTYTENIKPLKLSFTNNAIESCKFISFLRIEISHNIRPYTGDLKNYFLNSDNKKINFFTDISNYISYETGQPTHCYDFTKIKETFSLNEIDKNSEFITLLDTKVELKGKNLVFSQDNEIINLAGVMGGLSTSCNQNTTSALIECAYFDPEKIIGKSIKYDLKSDASYKFERGVDPSCHEKVLRRFISLVQEHADIECVEMLVDHCDEYDNPIKADVEDINMILGTKISHKRFVEYLSRLGFIIDGKSIKPPIYRSDINTPNDIAEEIARVIGYDNIESTPIQIPYVSESLSIDSLKEFALKNYLKEKGFYECINNSFSEINLKDSIEIDNPLDSNKRYLRINLKHSLIQNLLYNERRQKDSIKLFEMSNIYSIVNNKIICKKYIGLICSGRIGKNYQEFSKFINHEYLKNIISEFRIKSDVDILSISREEIKSKLKNEIVYVEILLDEIDFTDSFIHDFSKKEDEIDFVKYIPVSEFPSSYRDLSFSVKEFNFTALQDYLLNYKNELLKEVFIFDFYENQKNNEIKIGFRFIFQSHTSTITDLEVNYVMEKIIDSCLKIESVMIPGLKK